MEINIKQISKEILINLEQNKDEIFSPIFSELNLSPNLILKSEEEANELKDRTINLLNNCIDEFSGNEIPVIIQLIEDYYYNHRQFNNTNIGYPAKALLPKIYRRLDQENDDFEQEKIYNALVASLFYYYLDTALLYIEYFEESEIKFNISGFDKSILEKDYVKLLGLSYMRRGENQRTLNVLKDLIWKDGLKSVSLTTREIVKIINQEIDAKDSKYFEGTFFCGVGNDKNEFWSELLSRLFAYTQIVSVQRILNPFGIIEVQNNNFKSNFEINFPKNISEYYELPFWSIKWLDSIKSKYEDGKLITTRPFISLHRNSNRFFTTPNLIGDSINSFIEDAIMHDFNRRRYKLKDKIFEDNISNPFEEKVVNWFISKGFLAGEVNNNGVWKNQENINNLGLRNSEKIPGQIDCLAISKSEKVINLIECKVIKTPDGHKSIRNVLNKLGIEDSDGFHYKLDKKIDWISKIYPDFKIQGMILTDRFVPMKKVIVKKHVVISFEAFTGELNEFLNKNTPPNKA